VRAAAVLLALLLFAPARSTAQEVHRSRSGMVVSGSALASETGAAALARGGNAVDAAVTTAFALSVVEPTMSGIGGRTQILIRTPDGSYHGVDGTTEVPAAYRRGMMPIDDEDAYGWGTIAIPGTIAALAAALEAHGTITLADAMAPAIRLAEQGFELPEDEARRIAAVAGRLGEFEGSRRHFLRADGTPYRAGELFVQKELAAVLRTVAEKGPDAFYSGDIARRMADDVTANGGWLRYEDLAGYRAESAELARGRYRGHELVGTYLPASGATTIQTMQILEHFDVAGHAGTAEWIALLARALELAFEDRANDLASAEMRVDDATSPQRAKELAARMGSPAAIREEAYEGAHTTHLSVADAKGGVVALTQSVGPTMGSKVATAGLGFAYAATMGYLGDIGPGDRPMSSQSPLIVERDGQPVLVLGGAGARRIISAIVAVLSRVIDEQLELPAAMAAPRLHTTSGRIDVESHAAAAWADDVVSALRAAGAEVRTRDQAPYFARINAIGWERDGTLVGVPDPRWSGRAASPDR
jgi:gamma-glutamyltranspeptidase / glutathione hydrolase